MPSKKYQRLVASDAASFHRSHGTLDDAGKAILIVTEGEVTEPAYFKEVRGMLASLTVELVTHGAGAGDPSVLARKALALRKERRQKARDRELRLGQLEDFDELWIVFDTDVIDSAKLSTGLRFAKRNGVKIAASTPSFEFWLLLHYCRTTKCFEKCEHVVAALEKEMQQDYSKTKSAARKLMPYFLPKTQKAIGHAIWVRKYHLDAQTEAPANPSTDVDLLIAAIQKAASPANQPFQF